MYEILGITLGFLLGGFFLYMFALAFIQYDKWKLSQIQPSPAQGEPLKELVDDVLDKPVTPQTTNKERIYSLISSSDSPVTFTQIGITLHMKNPIVSRHLKALRQEGRVRKTKAGYRATS